MNDASPIASLDSSSGKIQHNNPTSGPTTDVLQLAILGTGYTAVTLPPINVNSKISGSNSNGILTAVSFQSYVGTFGNDPTALPGSEVGPVQNPNTILTINGPTTNQNTTLPTSPGSPFSVAHLFTLTMAGTADGNQFMVSLGGDTTLTSSTPEPSSIALISLCVTGFGGYSWRRKRQQQKLSQSAASVPA